jgi:hypothetical protein
VGEKSMKNDDFYLGAKNRGVGDSTGEAVPLNACTNTKDQRQSGRSS